MSFYSELCCWVLLHKLSSLACSLLYNRHTSLCHPIGLPVISGYDSLDSEKKTALLACFGVPKLKSGGTVASGASGVEFVDVLSASDDQGSELFPASLAWGAPFRTGAARILLDLLAGRLPFGIDARIFVAESVVALLDTENETNDEGGAAAPGGGGTVRAAVADAFDIMVEDDVLRISKDLLAGLDGDTTDRADDRRHLNEKVATILSYVASAPAVGEDPAGKESSCRILLREMTASVSKWSVPCQAYVELVKLFAILASRFGSLDEAGKIVIGLIGSGAEETVQRYIDPAAEFFDFVASLDRLVNDRPSTRKKTLGPVVVENDVAAASLEIVEKKKPEKPPLKNVCTFVETGEGFTEQHWYNCYTCGLIWDKVCHVSVRFFL